VSTDLTVHDARVLTARIRESVAGVWDLIVEAYTSRAWTSLGYDSWDDYTRTEFDGVRIALPREDRREVIGSLRDAGLSTRAIASAIGVNDKTVRNDLAGAEYSAPVIGADGKQYAPKPAHVTTTTRTTEATKVEHDVDLETGEITSPDSAPAVTGEVPPLADSGPAPGVEPEQESGALDLTQQRDTGAVYDLLREIAITVVMQGEHASCDASFSYDGIEVEVDDSACHIWVCGESKSRQVWVCLPIRLERSGTPGLAEALKSRGVIA